MRYTPQGSSYDRRQADIAVLALVLFLIFCLGGNGGVFNHPVPDQAGKSGPESRILQDDQPYAVVRDSSLLERLWRGEESRPGSDRNLDGAGEEILYPSDPVVAFPDTAPRKPIFFINPPAVVVQVESPRQPRAPPETLVI